MVTQAGRPLREAEEEIGRRFATSRSRPIQPDVSRSLSTARPSTDWPASHFNDKQVDIDTMVAMLDEAIADSLEVEALPAAVRPQLRRVDRPDAPV
jgi:hypothetical protein